VVLKVYPVEVLKGWVWALFHLRKKGRVEGVTGWAFSEQGKVFYSVE
jgi:hypothetical protein